MTDINALYTELADRERRIELLRNDRDDWQAKAEDRAAEIERLKDRLKMYEPEP